MTSQQIEGNEPLHENWGAETGDSIDEVGDPPRIWTLDLELPGCAFTRSLGELMAISGERRRRRRRRRGVCRVVIHLLTSPQTPFLTPLCIILSNTPFNVF